MSKRKQTKAIHQAIYKLFRYLSKLVQTAALGFSQWLMRSFLILGRKQRRPANAKAGFVLPTVTLLLLVVSLVIGAILLRTGSRTNQVIGAREEQVIYNAATPAIERAKAKLEYLFSDKEADRRPTGVPSDEVLMSMLLNDENQYYPGMVRVKNPDPYTLQDERLRRIDINNDGRPDAAWSYEQDVDNDGRPEKIVYSILLRRREGTVRLEDNNDQRKSLNLVVRNGPINTIDISNSQCSSVVQQNNAPAANNGQPVLTDPSAWFPVSTATLRKTFQVNAIVISNKGGTSRTVATLEFQQDRELNRGNKWGAWFRNDLEISPAGNFNWNGAMYTAGNLIVGNSGFKGFLISAPNSCFYKDASSSEIVVNKEDPDGFQGQIVAGRLGTNDFVGNSPFHVKLPNGNPNQNSTHTALQEKTDSVDGNKPPANIALDPIKILTEDKSESREPVSNNPLDRNNRNTRDQNWDRDNETAGEVGYLRTRGRIVNRNEETPFVDDTYRADDRYGPKPRYKLINLDSNKKNGNNIVDPADRAVLTNNTTDPLDTEFRNLGLDGYWERRAWANGFRVIVGERLELGNAFGWGNKDVNGNPGLQDTELDPLYPHNPSSPNLTNVQRQRRTWRDNLAAVQATAVYHIANANAPAPQGDVPVACIATTAHPGTQATMTSSKNFRLASQTYSYNGAPPLYSDFFTGLGTNGWEFNAPNPTALNGGDWLTALRNLANFAGDYEGPNNNGAFPPTQAGGRVFPDPYLTMWGNFSNLRRALEATNNSIADKSYVHTAACTLGILAYNVNYFDSYNYGSDTGLTSLAADLTSLVSPSGINGNSIQIPTDPNDANATATITRRSPSGAVTTETVRFSQLTPDDYINLLPAGNQRLARFIAMKEQIERDRQLGFRSISIPSAQTFDPDGAAGPVAAIPVACDATTLSGVTPPDAIRLLCPSQPKYPSLYYLFPRGGHGRTSGDGTVDSSEPYINLTNPRPVSWGGFNRVGNLANIALQPKQDGSWNGCNSGGWCLPTTDQANTSETPVETRDFRIVAPNGNERYVSLIDNALYNPRELMSVRVLDMDLNLLRLANSIGSDSWLPTSGIVYAFREDAVREDAIARPAGGAMNANAPTDPTLETNGISRKAVDYYPDPERRPHGFRLRNGKDLRRGDNNPRGLTLVSDNPVYIQGDFNYHSRNGQDNALLEEFEETLEENWGNFYRRSRLKNEFARIGPDKDTWRPSEILADAITILSDNFVEGSIDRGLRNNTDDANSPERYSFRAINGPNQPTNNTGPSAGWVLEDGNIISNPATNLPIPIKISRNGHPLYCNAGTPGSRCQPNQLQEYSVGNGNNYRDLAFNGSTDYRELINQATQTRVNATIISGIVPSRQFQTYGGFHNFPRFIERWQATNLFISGSFMQLNFSNYATGPFEQKAWEPGDAPQPDGDQDDPASIRYYWPPKRRWGYDVGLQYAPAGPAAQRLVSSSSSRSEFYQDLKADDPYICRLRRGLNARDGNWDRPSVNECSNNANP
jgi:hypothetical protein